MWEAEILSFHKIQYITSSIIEGKQYFIFFYITAVLAHIPKYMLGTLETTFHGQKRFLFGQISDFLQTVTSELHSLKAIFLSYTIINKWNIHCVKENIFVGRENIQFTVNPMFDFFRKMGHCCTSLAKYLLCLANFVFFVVRANKKA